MVRNPTDLKEALLSNFSHEFRTPLNGIVGFAEMLVDEAMGPIGAEQKEALENILACARRLVVMVDDVLAISDATAGPITFHPQPVVLSRLCGQVVEQSWPRALQKRIQLEVSVDPDVEYVVLDPERLTQLLHCFLSNALKFTPEGGRVSVRAARENERELRVQVRDTGVGIDPQDFDRLFDAFEQLDSGAGKQFQGLGLGLALTKRIVEQQGGRIGVESRPGEGSTFFALLPYEGYHGVA